MAANRSWSFPLPSAGRSSPRITLSHDATVQTVLTQFVTTSRSCLSMFERRIPAKQARWLNLFSRRVTKPPFLRECTPEVQFRFLMSELWCRDMSQHFQRTLSSLLRADKLSTVIQWFYTADAVVMPLLISAKDRPLDEVIADVDRLCKFALENCANSYSNFTGRLKLYKKLVRKHVLSNRYFSWGSVPDFRDMRTYRKVMCFHMRKIERTRTSDQLWLQSWLLWLQPRASGLADQKMMRESLTKFLKIISEEDQPIQVDVELLRKATMPARYPRMHRFKLSAGPSGTFQCPRSRGGADQWIRKLSRHRCLTREFTCFRSLTFREHVPAIRVGSSEDLLSWAIQEVLDKPVLSRMVRVHVVTEPSKARVITVPTSQYAMIMHALNHAWSDCFSHIPFLRTGFTKGRHLWSVLTDTLDPDNEGSRVFNQDLFGLSLDFEEATDNASLSFAKRIFSWLLIHSVRNPDFPIGLALLAKKLFTGKRPVLVPVTTGKYKLYIKRRGWLMGDPLTKLMLSISQYYVYCSLHNTVGSAVGDDLVLFSGEGLESVPDKYRQLGFKISDPDTYVSEFAVFFCEEAALIPATADYTTRVARRMGYSLPYVDYPRIRLLLPFRSDSHRHSYEDIGRYSLLGKEARWCHLASQELYPAFHVAQLLQLAAVPVPSDIISPVLPVELGGAGQFYNCPSIVEAIMDTRSKDRDEARYRAHQALTGEVTNRYLRVNSQSVGNTSYHRWLPATRMLKSMVPSDGIIEAEPTGLDFLLSVRGSGWIHPQAAIMRMAGSAYYRELLRGKDPPKLSFKYENDRTHGHTVNTQVDFRQYVDVYAYRNFNFRNQAEYLVNQDVLVKYDYMRVHVGTWATNPSEFREWISEHMDTISMGRLLVSEAVLEGTFEVPERYRRCLHLFCESDEFIVQEVKRLPVLTKNVRNICIVTNDIRLVRRIIRAAFEYGRLSRFSNVHVVDPGVYLAGMADTDDLHPSPEVTFETSWILDPGSIHHSEMSGAPYMCMELGVEKHPIKNMPHVLSCVKHHIAGFFHGYTEERAMDTLPAEINP